MENVIMQNIKNIDNMIAELEGVRILDPERNTSKDEYTNDQLIKATTKLQQAKTELYQILRDEPSEDFMALFNK